MQVGEAFSILRDYRNVASLLEAEKDIRTQNQAVLVGFRTAYVFDVSQTEGEEQTNSPDTESYLR